MARGLTGRFATGAVAVAVAAGVGLAAGCGGSDDSGAKDAATDEAAAVTDATGTGTEAVQQTPSDAEEVAVDTDGGDIVVRYVPPEDPANQFVADVITDSGMYDGLADALNTQFALPQDLEVVFAEGEGPAYYPDEQGILYDWGFLTLASDIFASQGDEGEALGTSLAEVSAFVFYHELGHAFVDLYDLPVTGKEEDAVDQLATVIAVWSEYPQMAISGARLFDALSADSTDPQWADFADEHSLDQQRVANIACWVIGSDPDGVGAELQAAVQLPEDRLVRCEDEWAQIEKSWATLLAPHILEQPEAAAEGAAEAAQQ